VNVALLTQRCSIMKQADKKSEFQEDDEVAVFSNVPCDLDTIYQTRNNIPIVVPGTQQGRAQGVISIVDPRLGRAPRRKFDETNWIRLNGQEWQIAQIHEVLNKMSGEMDHFEVYCYEGLNRDNDMIEPVLKKAS